MEQIPVELIVSEESVRAGVSAMEHIHGRHLASMTPSEQEEDCLLYTSPSPRDDL